MALEQLSIVLGVVFGFWTGFITRSSMFNFYFGYNNIPSLVSYVLLVPSSMSWRIPLGIQIIPGIILALGCFFLPPSPRLLVLHGRYDEALTSLARLRLRTPQEAESDPLLHVRFQLMSLPLLLSFYFCITSTHKFIDRALRNACRDRAHQSFTRKRTW